MRINNNDNSHLENQAKRDSQRNQKPDVPKPLFTNFKSKIATASSIDMHNNRMRGISDPKTDVDPINFRYLQENFVPKTSISNRSKSSTRFLPRSGGTMKGNINMGGNKVIELQDLGTNPSRDQAATVGYVKDRAGQVAIDPNLVEKVKELNELLKQLEIIEEALGIKPISPDTPPQRRKMEKNSKILLLCNIKAVA